MPRPFTVVQRLSDRGPWVVRTELSYHKQDDAVRSAEFIRNSGQYAEVWDILGRCVWPPADAEINLGEGI